MSYYFTIIGTKDQPLFTHEFGTSKQGGDGVSRFTTSDRHLNAFIAHSSLDIVEELQYGPNSTSGGAPMYLKHIDKFQNAYISCWITGGNVKFLLLTSPSQTAPGRSGLSGLGGGGSGGGRGSYPVVGTYNPTSPATEEAVKNFFLDVYDGWVKTIMNPFYQLDQRVTSPVFKGRVAAAAKKYL